MSSEQVMFPSGTVRCAADLYLPDDTQETTPIPAVLATWDIRSRSG